MKRYQKLILKYILETLIIIIGVLSAFYLSNWGESIQKKKTEKEIIRQIYYDLKLNLTDLKNDLEIHKTAIRSHLNVQKLLDDKINYSDSMVFDFYWMTRDEYAYPNSSGYENLKSKGIDFVQNDSVRQLITIIYNSDFPRLKKGNTIYPDIKEYFDPFMQSNFKVNQDTSLKFQLKLRDSIRINYPRNIGNGITQVIGYHPLNVESLKVSEQFRYLVSESFQFRMYKLNFYSRCISNVDTLLNLIEEKYL